MASDFIGYTILVTLQNPPNAQIQGVVADVVNQKLFLQNVLLLWNGRRLTSYAIDSSAIADLEVSPTQRSPFEEQETLTPVAATSNVAPIHPAPHPPQNAPTFIDPAIVSYAKPPAKVPTVPAPTSLVQPVSPIMIADGVVSNSSQARPRNGNMGNSSVSSIATAVPTKAEKRNTPASATLTEPFDALNLGSEVAQATPVSLANKENNAHTIPSRTGPGIIDMKDINSPLKNQKKTGKGKGWRQTPLIEEVPRQPKKKAQRGRKVAEDLNGWATEDATDIQDMGDFDFESNLSKFDKRRVFDDIRQADTTAEADRLVSFNRRARPGTNGGRNLHYTENVLDAPDGKDRDRWKSEAGETEDDLLDHDGHYSSGRGSRRAASRRPLQSRKGSVIPSLLERTESPRPLTRLQTSSPLNGSVSGIRASFKLQNNKPCHCLSPLQMLEIEQLCTSEMGLTEDMLSENAGRSIAMAVLKLPDIRSVVFLIGNHKSGARAIAAARHLRNRRLRVTIVVLGGEREEMLLETMKKQLAIYKKGQGYVDRWDEYQAKSNAGGPAPDVIVDVLLGVHVTFEELRTDDQATVLEMIRWANRSSLVVSIDVPSGLSATTGLLTEVDGQFLVMNSKHIVSLGAPKAGLLHAMAIDGLAEPPWQVWVVDIGISAAAWQKHGSRRKHGVDFGPEWVVPVKFVLGA
ncbi:YjeF family domain-containing protein [Cladophialophora carrionii CBS 160.54]|uniref:Enhancer of mRNA-decapping protein 3 n=1 Tax=Cladophialophora carrionii CBS 160.54 TaxID=1279043 RepID=V9D3P8_9EURO|nr:YjeF family domain-containing protein [Cladophialophora carrionii CBS 160.54]ETI21524.1 YjeF family domain-containing protein [Cladophialophora carrionii CBS 160.54]